DHGPWRVTGAGPNTAPPTPTGAARAPWPAEPVTAERSSAGEYIACSAAGNRRSTCAKSLALTGNKRGPGGCSISTHDRQCATSKRPATCGWTFRNSDRDSTTTPGTVCITTSTGGNGHRANTEPTRAAALAVFEVTSTSSIPPPYCPKSRTGNRPTA